MSTVNPPYTTAVRQRVRLGLTPYGITYVGLLALAVILAVRLSFTALAFNDAAFINIGQVLAPLLVVAAFTERAVEVILTPWRGTQADLMQGELDAATKEPSRAAEVPLRTQELQRFKLDTRQYAFLLSSSFGLAAALFGVRGITALLQPGQAIPGAFKALDVLMTGVVIGGGADAIHKIVDPVLKYMAAIKPKP